MPSSRVQLGELMGWSTAARNAVRWPRRSFRLLADGTGPRAQVASLVLEKVSQVLPWCTGRCGAGGRRRPRRVGGEVLQLGGGKNAFGFLLGQVMRMRGSAVNLNDVNTLAGWLEGFGRPEQP